MTSISRILISAKCPVPPIKRKPSGERAGMSEETRAKLIAAAILRTWGN